HLRGKHRRPEPSQRNDGWGEDKYQFETRSTANEDSGTAEDFGGPQGRPGDGRPLFDRGTDRTWPNDKCFARERRLSGWRRDAGRLLRLSGDSRPGGLVSGRFGSF